MVTYKISHQLSPDEFFQELIMATLIIHGTMTPKAFAYSAKWWWDSWYENGFLYHVAKGMQTVMGSSKDDVWKICGKPVCETKGLTGNSSSEQLRDHSMTEKLSAIMFPGKLPETYWAHKGHFMWSGSDSHMLREQGGRALARYLNLIKKIAPHEPIRIIAHSHGCNVVKHASSCGLLDSCVHIERAIFLACPHFSIQVLRKIKYPYKLDPSKFGQILNLYSPFDSVQVKIAQEYPGSPDNMDFTIGTVKANREDQNPETKRTYINYEIPTMDIGIKAHTVMHGHTLGTLCGIFLSCKGDEFNDAYEYFKEKYLPVPNNDFGE